MMSNFTVDERLSPTAEIKTSTAHAPPKHDNQHCKLVSITLPNVGPQGLILSEQDDGKSLIIEEVIPQSQAEKRGVLAGDVPILLLNNFSSSVCRVHKISYDTFLQRARDERPFVFSVLRDTTDKSGSSSMNQSSIEEGAPSREKIDGACETNNINMDMEDIRITNTENVGQDYLANISGSAVVEDTSVELAAAAAFTSRTTNFTSLKNIHPPPPSSNPVPPTITDSTNTEQKTKISIRELEVYMKTWIANPENASALNLMPSTSQKNQIVLETGIERSRLESWLYRTRQRLIVAREKENQVGLLSAAEVATIISSSSLGPAGIPKPLTEEAKRGLTKWIEEHQIHPFPSRGEKDAFKKLYGIENDPQLDGFLCRARKKYEKNLHNNGTKRGNDISSSGSISISAVVSEASTPSVHSATTTNNNNAITPGSSMKLPKKKYDNVTPAKRFVARPSEFGLKNSDGDKAATPSIYNVQTPRHGAVSDQTTFRTQCLSKTAAYEKIEIPTINNERQELDQVVLDSSIAVQADTQVVSIETISNLNDEEPYIGSRYPSSVQPSRRVVASTDYYPGCNLRGAHPLPGSAKYKSIIFYEGNRYSLGKYEFVSDAALAYDKAALSIGPYWDINFASWDEYIATRTLEVMRKGRDQVDLTSVLEVMSSRASEVVSKVVDEAELNDFEWNQQSLGSTASVNHDERVKAYETARALYLSHSKLSSRNIKEEEYHVQEKVYAWDRGALYEAKVLKYKEADDDNESLQYFIHYLGYKSCHDKWLSPKDMMKLNSLNKRFYCQSRGILFMENEVVSHEDESFSYDEEKDNNLDQISVFSASSCGKQSRVSSEGFLSDAEWPVNRDGSNSLTQSTLSQSISLGLPNVKRGRGRQKKAKSQKRTKKSSSNSLPPGVNETTSGNYQVQVYYQGNNRNIGSFKTLESATLVSEIVRNMLKKDKGQQLSVVECERNVKLAKEAALAGVPNNEMCSKSTKRGRGRPRKDLQMNDCRDKDLEGGVSTNGRKRKLSKKKADVLSDQQTANQPPKKKRNNGLPEGVCKRTSGWQLQLKYQGRQRYIGHFRTLEQATLASNIARSMFKKDEGLQLSAEECERHFKLAKEAALKGVPHYEKPNEPLNDADKKRVNTAIEAVTTTYGVGVDMQTKLAAMVFRGVTSRPSGKWQAQVYYAGKPQYIGVFDTKVEASLAYEIARKLLNSGPYEAVSLSGEEIKANISLARRAALKGVSETSMEKEKDYFI